MSRITKIQQNGSQTNYDIGATFDNVICEYTVGEEPNQQIKHFSLKSLYNYIAKFFKEGTFVMRSNSEPLDERVQVWYDINVESENNNEDNSNDIDIKNDNNNIENNDNIENNENTESNNNELENNNTESEDNTESENNTESE